jgi:hypothetical protein
MRMTYFIGACVLAAAILVPLGAPILSVAAGIAIALFVKVAQDVKASRRDPKP